MNVPVSATSATNATSELVPTETGLPAPAVAAAVRILDYLAKRTPRAGVTEIARALDINKSTCFNVLATLAHFGMVAKLPGLAQYQLGPRLVELGGAVRRRYDSRDQLRRELEALVVQTGFVCVVGQILGDELSFVIIDQIAPPGARSRRPAPPVGAVFPLTGPALGCALLGCYDAADAIGIVRHFEPKMKPADELGWRGQLERIRRLGYATSLEQYKSGVNAVAAPIRRAGEAYLVVGLVGHPRDLTARRIEEIGPQLVRIVRHLSARLPAAGIEA